ncbi:MAG: 4Fe-4S dicluster domain-containing protein [Promethearchaeota archaeon]|nr:MAG: 4Fe-4S dicluster domain-containing protein [Candidatus Lokiarchaeota archaeon]
MSRKVLIFEPKKCVGCRLCEQLCSLSHYGISNPSKARIRIFRNDERQLDLATYCHQCSDAPCIQACKFEALSRDPETKAILVDEEKCVGCRQCIRECPYAAPTMHPNGDYVIICDLCGGSPACVDICPEHAIQYIDVQKANNIYKSIYTQKMAENLIQEEK